MENRKAFFRSFLALGMMALYFTIAITHIFFLPRLNNVAQKHSSSHNSIFKRKAETVSEAGFQANLLQRPDKSTLEDKRSAVNAPEAIVASFLLLFFLFQPWKLSLKRRLYFLKPVYSAQYSYLTFCTFRI
jgi:hypothetical protein